jgi:hypothetical protein
MRRTNLIVLGISLAFAAIVLFSLLHLEPVRVTDQRLDHLGNTVVVRGTATNTASNPQTAGLKVMLFDAIGHKLAEQTLELGKLAPGQSVKFNSRPVDASMAQKFSIQVDHGSNMYGN